MMKRAIFYLLVPILLFADKYGAEIFEFGFGARYLAMAGVGVSFVKGPSSLFYNPAGLYLNFDKTLLFMHSSFFKNLETVEHIAISPLIYGNKHLGISLSIFYSGGIEITELRDTTDTLSEDNQPVVKGYASYMAGILRAGVSDKIKGFNLGGTVKLIYEHAYTVNALGFGFDVGVLKKINSSINLGLVLRDITTTTLFWNTGKIETIYPHVVMGFSVARGNVLFAIDSDIHFENYGHSALYSFEFISFDPSMGLEWRPREFLNIRAGFKNENFTFGVGFDIKKIQLDYAFESNGELGGSHLISIAYAGL